MKNASQIQTEKLAPILLKLAEAALTGDRQRIELLCLNAIRSLKKELPDISKEISKLLAVTGTASATFRGQISEPAPADSDMGLALVRTESTEEAECPILNKEVDTIVNRFIRQRNECAVLLEAGLTPPRTLLLKGAPGTGKTMLAQWISNRLQLPLVILDLATSISSFLGKTGGNLKRSLDYARINPCVLLLDEFDAIGKRRDDITEVGELKRIVNVLLKELEYWPIYSVLVAATNHPELLDPAINRRFDIVVEIPSPGVDERDQIITRAIGRFSTEIPATFIHAISVLCGTLSGSELTSITQQAIRRHVLEATPLIQSFLETLPPETRELTDDRIAALKDIQKTADLTVRDIAQFFGRSPSTIQYHLTK